MTPRKKFSQVDISSLKAGVTSNEIKSEMFPPKETKIFFSRNSTHSESFDFLPFYGKGIDAVTLACQRQIERSIKSVDGETSASSTQSRCFGIKRFLAYLVLESARIDRKTELIDIKRETIDGFISFLSSDSISKVTQRGIYTNAKSVLKLLCRRGVILEIQSGESSTFPRNPYPGVHKATKSHRPLSDQQRNAFARAVKTALLPIYDDEVVPTPELLSYALLAIALHTGRNTTPLLEMKVDCLTPHPKEGFMFLTLFKRRGHTSSRVVLRDSKSTETGLESLPTVRRSIIELIRRVLTLSEKLRADAPSDVSDRVWLYRKQKAGRGKVQKGSVTALSEASIALAITKLVNKYSLVDADGNALKINISRLRTTFVNKIFELLDGDIVSTAAAAGHSVVVSDKSYLRPSEHSEKNWQMMGVALTNELLNNTVGATELTPVGRCSDNKKGEYAPKRNNATCMSFMNCVRCRNYVVTGDDLHKLFSFYWRLLNERSQMNTAVWQKKYSHVTRLIDRDIVEAGIANGVFKSEIVERERERARTHPHQFWSHSSIMIDLRGIG